MKQLKNNFLLLKTDFRNETGLDPEKEAGLYIQYFQAKVLDALLQTIHLDLQQIQMDIKMKK